jgi:hypothetical protein
MGRAPPAAVCLKALTLPLSLSLNVGVFPDVLLKGVSKVPVFPGVFVEARVKGLAREVFQVWETLSATSGVFPASIFGIETRCPHTLIVSPLCCELMIGRSAFLSAGKKQKAKENIQGTHGRTCADKCQRIFNRCYNNYLKAINQFNTFFLN